MKHDEAHFISFKIFISSGRSWFQGKICDQAPKRFLEVQQAYKALISSARSDRSRARALDSTGLTCPGGHIQRCPKFPMVDENRGLCLTKPQNNNRYMMGQMVYQPSHRPLNLFLPKGHCWLVQQCTGWYSNGEISISGCLT